jgi:glycosyltransferase involved in cell wall biosynthesis
MPRVSIIIPTYNRARLIRHTINSALAQTYQDYEIIVVDDGSTDDTLSVLSEFGNKIKAISQSHSGGGGAKARNTGISVANGELIAFLDSDDLWLPTKLEKQINEINKMLGLLWVYSDSEIFDSDSGKTLFLISQKQKLYEGDVLKTLLLRDFIPTPSHIVHRVVLDKVGGFWHSKKGTDWDMHLRIAANYPIKLVPEPLTRIRKHKDSVTGSVTLEEALHARITIVNRAIEREQDRLLPLKNKALSRVYTQSGQEHAVNGDISKAIKLLTKAIQLNPFTLNAYISLLGCLTGQRGYSIAKNIRQLFLRRM